MKRQWGNRIIAVCLLAALFIGQGMFAVASVMPAKEKRTLKVGYIGYEGFMYENEEGEMVGYGVEYLETIGDRANMDFEYIQSDWADSMEKLRNQELDLICTAFYSEERAREFDFSSQNFGRVRGVLYTRGDNEDIFYEDFENMNGKKIAFTEGTLNIEMMAEYAQKHGFTYEECIYKSEEEMEYALEVGEVDIIATEQMSIHEEYKLVAVYGSTLYYLMSYKDNDFMSDIDEAMMAIFVSDYDYEAYLYDKYYGEANRVHALCFTREEMEYIKENPTLTVGMLPGLYPLSYQDEKTGEAMGIYAGILEEIAKISGLNLVQVVMDPDENPVDTVGVEGKYDMAMSAVDEHTGTENEFINLTESFMDSSIGIVTLPGTVYDGEKPYRIAINNRFVSLKNYLLDHMQHCEIVEFDTDEECLYALLRGEADLMMQNVYVINYLLQKPAFENLELVPTSAILTSNSFIVSADADPRLISILNKAINYFSQDDLDRIVIQNTTALPYDYTLGDVWDKYGEQILMFGGLILLCFVLLGVLGITRQRNLKIVREKNTQLREAVNQALHANKSKSDFFARVSHEIRTPINAIVGITEIAKKSVENPDKTKESLDKIETSSKVLLSIVNDILDLSAIENAKMKIAEAAFEFKSLLLGIESIYGTQCKNKGIEFVVISEVEEKRLAGDVLRVNQVLLNLISNAFKFTKEGGIIKLKAYALGVHQGIVNVRFEVEDTGEGMSEEFLERVFLPFEQASSTTAHKHGGSGLGLSIAKNLVDMMGGQISVESRIGVGTKFTVDIPFGIVEEEVQQQEKEFSMEDMDFSGIRLLLADDNDLNREIAVDLLSMVNIQVDEAVDGQEALDMFMASEEGKYQGILMDIQMPQLNGYEATKEIRRSAHPQAQSIKIIAMTANAMQQDVTAAMSAGMDGHVSKPIDTEKLYRTLWHEIMETKE